MDSSSPGASAASVGASRRTAATTGGKPVGVDEVKRLQSVLHDLAKRLDDSHPKCRHVSDLFTPELNFFRVKLHDYCQRLFSADPIKHGSSAIDIFWRKGVYDTLVTARSIKQGWTPMERAYVQSHLLNGIGHFEHFLLLAMEELGGSAKILEKLGWIHVDFVMGKSYGNSKQAKDKPRVYHYDSESVSSWIKQTVHRCLMCLGDLSRYLTEFFPDKQTLADRYYRQALMVDPTNGIPFNQLATLAGDTEYGLNAAFFYLRSLTCKKPFEGGEANLKKLLERNNKAFLKFSSSNSNQNDLDVLSPRAETERCIVFLLEMTSVFVFEEAAGRKLSELCQKALQSVQHCLYLPLEDTSAIQSLLPDTVASKMVLVLLLVMEKVRNKESRLSMLRAYLLALFSHFVTKFLADLHLGLFGPESLLELFESKEKEDSKDEPDEVEVVKMGENGDAKPRTKKVKGLDRFKRRRRGGESSGDDSYDEDGSDDSSDTSSEVSEASSLDSLNGDADNGNGILDSDEFSDEDDEDDVIIESSKEILSTLNLVKLVNSHHLNQAIRICSLWLMKSPSIVKEAGPTSEVLWSRLTKLFNTLSLTNPDYEANDQVVHSMAKCESIFELQALPEDFNLRGVSVFESDLEKIKWDISHNLDFCDMGVIRILHYLKFRDWLCRVRESNVEENGKVPERASDDKADFLVEDLDSSRNNVGKPRNGLICLKRSDIGEECGEKKKMMENMAQLWLQQEVHDLEGKGARNKGTFRGFAHYSPYIVVDHFALSNHLHMVKEIVASKKFAVIIPSAVIQQLDEMKKTQSGARTAIRWLEKQFQDGNRWLRPQRKNESRGLEIIQYPKKKDKGAWHYFKILECCNHFALVRGEDLNRDRVQVTLLTAKNAEETTEETELDAEKKQSTFSPLGLASSINIRVENIDDFLQHAGANSNARPKWQKNKKIKWLRISEKDDELAKNLSLE